MPRTIRSRLSLAFAGAFLLLGAIVFMTYRSTQRLIEANQQGQRSIQRLLELERTFANVGDAETGQRGYLITGDDAYLQPFHTAVEQIPGHRSRLASLGLDGPTLARFDSLVDRKVNELGATIGIFRTVGPEAAREFVKNNSGKAVMDSLRTTLNQLTQAERQYLGTVGPLERDRARWVILTITALSLVGLVVLGSFFVTMWRYSRDRQAALADLGQEREQLEERVRERTAALEIELTQRLSAEEARHVSGGVQRRHLRSCGSLYILRDVLRPAGLGRASNGISGQVEPHQAGCGFGDVVAGTGGGPRQSHQELKLRS